MNFLAVCLVSRLFGSTRRRGEGKSFHEFGPTRRKGGRSFHGFWFKEEEGRGGKSFP